MVDDDVARGVTDAQPAINTVISEITIRVIILYFRYVKNMHCIRRFIENFLF